MNNQRNASRFVMFACLWTRVDSLEEVLDKAGIKHPNFGWPSDPRAVEDWLNEENKQGGCK
jgi:hypothetical protein